MWLRTVASFGWSAIRFPFSRFSAAASSRTRALFRRCDRTYRIVGVNDCQILVNERNGRSAVADREHAGHTRLEGGKWLRPPAAGACVAGEHEPMRIQRNAAAPEPVGFGI